MHRVHRQVARDATDLFVAHLFFSSRWLLDWLCAGCFSASIAQRLHPLRGSGAYVSAVDAWPAKTPAVSAVPSRLPPSCLHASKCISVCGWQLFRRCCSSWPCQSSTSSPRCCQGTSPLHWILSNYAIAAATVKTAAEAAKLGSCLRRAAGDSGCKQLVASSSAAAPETAANLGTAAVESSSRA